MLEEMWQLCQTYKSSGVRDKTGYPFQRGVLELAITMGTVRAIYRPEQPPYGDEAAWQQAAELLLKDRQLLSDYRDDSYVYSTAEGTYLGRMRFEELLFTPDRFEDKEPLLAELLGFYDPTP